jgi:hypothetical protein
LESNIVTSNFEIFGGGAAAVFAFAGSFSNVIIKNNTFTGNTAPAASAVSISQILCCCAVALLFCITPEWWSCLPFT